MIPCRLQECSAYASSFHCTGSESLDNVLLQKQGDDDDRDGHDHRAGHQAAPVDVGIGDEAVDGHRQSLGVSPAENDAEHEVVPGEDEGENGRGYDAGSRDGQDDFQKAVEAGAAVHRRRLLEFLWKGLEERDHDPDDEGKGHHHVGEDEAEVGVDDADEGEDDKPRHQEGDSRNHPDHQ